MSIHTTHTAGASAPHHPSRSQSPARGLKTPKGTQATRGKGLSKQLQKHLQGSGSLEETVQRHLQETVKSSGCCFPCGQQGALLTAVGARDPSSFLPPLPPSGIFHSPLDTHTHARTHPCTHACMHARTPIPNLQTHPDKTRTFI